MSNSQNTAASTSSAPCVECGHSEDDHDGYGGLCDGLGGNSGREVCGCFGYIAPYSVPPAPTSDEPRLRTLLYDYLRLYDQGHSMSGVDGDAFEAAESALLACIERIEARLPVAPAPAVKPPLGSVRTPATQDDDEEANRLVDNLYDACLRQRPVAERDAAENALHEYIASIRAERPIPVDNQSAAFVNELVEALGRMRGMTEEESAAYKKVLKKFFKPVEREQVFTAEQVREAVEEMFANHNYVRERLKARLTGESKQ